jgi:hypothetical protein
MQQVASAAILIMLMHVVPATRYDAFSARQSAWEGCQGISCYSKIIISAFPVKRQGVSAETLHAKLLLRYCTTKGTYGVAELD